MHQPQEGIPEGGAGSSEGLGALDHHPGGGFEPFAFPMEGIEGE